VVTGLRSLQTTKWGAPRGRHGPGAQVPSGNPRLAPRGAAAGQLGEGRTRPSARCGGGRRALPREAGPREAGTHDVYTPRQGNEKMARLRGMTRSRLDAGLRARGGAESAARAPGKRSPRLRLPPTPAPRTATVAAPLGTPRRAAPRGGRREGRGGEGPRSPPPRGPRCSQPRAYSPPPPPPPCLSSWPPARPSRRRADAVPLPRGRLRCRRPSRPQAAAASRRVRERPRPLGPPTCRRLRPLRGRVCADAGFLTQRRLSPARSAPLCCAGPARLSHLPTAGPAPLATFSRALSHHVSIPVSPVVCSYFPRPLV
jgi:hypothetical protein